jgi:membrane-bound serine protease (ClpP class)
VIATLLYRQRRAPAGAAVRTIADAAGAAARRPIGPALRAMSGALLGLLSILAGLMLPGVGSARAQGGGGLLSMAAPAPSASPAATVAAAAAVHASGWTVITNIVLLPPVTILLLVAGCLLLFHDLLTPFTWGTTGTIGIGLMATVLVANVTQHTYGWVGVLLVLVGLALILAEIHVYPGRGLAAVSGLLVLFLGMFLALGGLRNAAFSLITSGALTAVAMLSFFAYLPKSPIWKQIGREMRQRAALAQGNDGAHAPFLGRHGVAVTGLRPSGTADIGGVRLNVVTEGDFLTAGAPVVVARIEGTRIVVERVSSGAAAAVAAAPSLEQVARG